MYKKKKGWKDCTYRGGKKNLQGNGTFQTQQMHRD